MGCNVKHLIEKLERFGADVLSEAGANPKGVVRALSSFANMGKQAYSAAKGDDLWLAMDRMAYSLSLMIGAVNHFGSEKAEVEEAKKKLSDAMTALSKVKASYKKEDVEGDDAPEGDTLEEGYGLVAQAMVEKMVDKKKLREIRKKADPETAEMAREVWMEMIRRLDKVTHNTGFQEAINRLNNAANMQDEGSIRNFVFKAANSLGMKLPHGIF